jgi:Subtilase family
MKRIFVFMSIFVLSTVIAQGKAAHIQRHTHPVQGRYMVLLDKTIPLEAYEGVVQSLAASYNLEISTFWRNEPRGFICDKVGSKDIERLANDPRVYLIEEDFEFTLSATQWSTYQGQYLWNLDRLDEPTYWTADSQYDMCPEGRSIYAYMLDLGVRADHEQFNLGEINNRVVLSLSFENGANGVPDTMNGCAATNLWHGTATASVLAGTTVGAAKPHIISLRFADCNGHGQVSWLVNAVRWIKSINDPYRSFPSLVNYSGGQATWDPNNAFLNMNEAVRTLVTSTQIPFFTSAENYAGDACMFSPNDLAYTNIDHNGLVFTVGGTSVGAGSDRNDYRWQKWDSNNQPQIGFEAGSDGGRCVSIYAPALGIYHAVSSAATGLAAYDTQDGTSFSSPMTAGIAARYMEKSGFRDYIHVFNYLLDTAASTGTVVNNVNTSEFWLCESTNGNVFPPTYSSRTPITTCPPNYDRGPVHSPATFNESHAGMVYSNMTCP